MQESSKTLKIKSPESTKIYVVDDDKFVVDMIGRSLNMVGFANVAVYNSAEKFIKENIDDGKLTGVVISDLVLPGISGFDLCRRIKNYNEDIPVILISGFDIEDVHSRVLDCGADDFIAKPFNPIELSTRLKLHIARLEKTNSSVNKNTSLVGNSSKVPTIGDRIGNYIINDTIGWGRSSFVFKVRNVKNAKIYTLKMLTPHATDFRDMVSRFNNEIDIMEKIKHPNIISFFERGFYNSVPYVIMEYISGLDLEEYLITKGKIPFHDSLAISAGIASAIVAIHSHNVVHRDIKLKNIIFDVVVKLPKLIDFGIAQTVDSMHLTRDGFIVGTPIYMAPEIFEGEEANMKSDIYSFGVMAYHLITGSPPFVADSTRELYRKHLSEPPPPMNNFRDDIPEEIEKIISDGCLAKKPSRRPSSMKIVEGELRRFLL